MSTAGRGRGRGGGQSARGGSPFEGQAGRPSNQSTMRAFREGRSDNPPIDTSYRPIEEKFATRDLAAQMAQLGLKQDLPLRDGYGTVGPSIELWTNHFSIKIPDGLTFYRYEYKFSPEVKGRKKTRLMEKSLNQPELARFKGRIATDYKRYLITTEKLPNSAVAARPIVHTMEDEDEPGRNDPVHQSQRFTIGLLQPTTLPVMPLLAGLSDPAHGLPDNRQEIISCLNIITSHEAKSCSLGPHPTLMSAAANRFCEIDGNGRKDLGKALMGLRGYLIAIREAAGRLLVNMQIKHLVMYKPGDLRQIITEFGGQDLRALGLFLRKRRVALTHLPIKRNTAGKPIERVKTMFDLATSRNDGQNRCPRYGARPSEVRFKLTDDHGIVSWPSVAEYFQNKYHLTVSENFPVLNLGSVRDPRYFPADCLVMLAGQQYPYLLPPAQMNSMTDRFAVRPAYQNAESIERESQAMLRLNTANNVLRGMNLRLGDRLQKVTGRVLPAPSLQYGTAGKSTIVPKGGAWNLREGRFCKPIKDFHWAILRIRTTNNKRDYQHNNFVQDDDNFNAARKTFEQQMSKLGLGAKGPVETLRYTVDNEDRDTTMEALKNYIAKSFGDYPKKYKVPIVLVVAPKNTRIFNRVKLSFDTEIGVRSVYVTGPIFAKNSAQVMANVLMKFNLHVGGANQRVSPQSCGLWADGKTMFMGVDIAHPSPSSTEDAPSIAAYVGNPSGDTAQFPPVYRCQRKDQKQAEETATDLKAVTLIFLKQWFMQHDRTLPDNLICYRDGVSEGQLNMVNEIEARQTKEACRDAAKNAGIDKQISVCVIVTTKRHHVRFYPTSTLSGNIDGNSRSQSALPGTVVDRDVTSPYRFNCFLQPHAALQGTSKSSQTTVIYDEIFAPKYRRLPPITLANVENSADYLQLMTNSISYAYGRATRAVSLPPPVFYADLAAERARRWLSRYFEPTSAERGSDNGAAAAGNAPLPTTNLHPNLNGVMHYI